MTSEILFGVVVDGQAEYHSLPHIYRKLSGICTVIDPPLYCDIQPSAPPKQNALKIVEKAKLLVAKGAQHILVMYDKEQQHFCPRIVADELAQEVTNRLTSLGIKSLVSVVLKVRKYENWLIADCNALQQSGRFNRVGKIRQQVYRNKADSVVDAAVLLGKHSISGSYDKKRDSIAITQKMNPMAVALNSRSFRRFLRIVGVQKYINQSKRP